MSQANRTARQPGICAVCRGDIRQGEPINVISLTGYSIAAVHPACKDKWVRERRRVPAKA